MQTLSVFSERRGWRGKGSLRGTSRAGREGQYPSREEFETGPLFQPRVIGEGRGPTSPLHVPLLG